ncbi:hypothetical protein FO519_006755 [Halicephalobus sp. NKZ332]|nr:hypothetical protein FO519_006755 [Halicephalobus sp. NKZ332]
MEVSNNGRCLGYRPSKGAPYKFITFAEVFKKSREVGSALLNVLGQKPGNKTNVGIYARNSPEWFITCLGNARYSMVTVPLYDTLGAEAAAYIVQQADIEVIFVDDISKIKKLLDSASQMPSLKHIVLISKESKALEPVESLAKSQNIQLHLFEEIRRLGETSLVDDIPPRPDDLFIICYTSGTTGNPKGVMLTHRNVCANCAAFVKIMRDFNVDVINTNQIIVSYLPLSHMFEQICHWCVLGFGSAVGYYSGDIATLMDDLKDLQPTIFPVVPRLLNRLYDSIQSKVSNSGSLAKMIFNFALSQKRNLLRERVITNKSIWDKLVFNKIQQQVGGKVRLVITGSAPINSEVLEMCRIALGAVIVEGYGQTEATAMTTCTWPGDPVGGHCGGPGTCSLIKLGDVPELEYFASDGKGEVLIKGPCVTPGYFKNPELTKELFDEDGFLKTGDIGHLLPTGGLQIIDRKKHIFKLAQGEYVAPEKIENIYVRSPFVQQVFVDGSSLERFLIAIIVPEPTEVLKWYKGKTGKETTIEKVCEDKETVKMIIDDITKLGKENKLNSIEQVKEIYLESVPWSVENGLLTPTLKAKRPQLRKKYQDTIALLYKQTQ